MAKKTKKQSLWPEMTPRGCMPRLIKIFNSRHARLSQRLLSVSDRRPESSLHSNFSGNEHSNGNLNTTIRGEIGPEQQKDADGCAGKEFVRSTSVRYLTQEEMSKDPNVHGETLTAAHDAEIREQPSTSSEKKKAAKSSRRLSMGGLLEEYSSNGSTKELAENEGILSPIYSPVRRAQDKAFKKGTAAKKNSKLLEKWKSVEPPTEETQSGKLLQMQKIHRLFQKKQKSRDGDVAVDRKVVFNPKQSLLPKSTGRADGEERLNSNFSLKEVKRKLKHAMQDYRRESQTWLLGSTRQNSCDSNQRKSVKLKGKATEFQNLASASHLSEREYEFQREAKRHLATMLSNLSNDRPSPALPSSSRPFCKILTMLETNSQFPEREEDSLVDSNQGRSIPNASDTIEAAASSLTSDEVSRQLNSPCSDSVEPPCPNPAPGRDSPDAESEFHAASPDSPSEAIRREKPERPSPVSILDALFLEEDSSPAVDFLGQLRHIEFDEFPPTPNCRQEPTTFFDNENHTKVYLWRVLETSGIIQSENRERWHSTSPMLNPSLYNEVSYPCAEIPDDMHLLFDSANEVLEQMREKFMESCTKPFACPFPVEDKLLQLVLDGIESNCAYQVPESLEQIMDKDLGTWMNLRPEIDEICAVMEDEIMEDMIDEIVFARVDQILRRRNATPIITAVAAAAAPPTSFDQELSFSAGRGGAVGWTVSSLAGSISFKSTSPPGNPRSHKIRADTVTTPRSLPDGVFNRSRIAWEVVDRRGAIRTEDTRSAAEPRSFWR